MSCPAVPLRPQPPEPLGGSLSAVAPRTFPRPRASPLLGRQGLRPGGVQRVPMGCRAGGLDTPLRMTGSAVGESDAWRAGLLLRQVHQRKHQAVDSAPASLGISMSRYVVLRAVTERPDSPAHDLAVRTGQTDQSLGALVRRLTDSGLAERTSGPGRVHRHPRHGARRTAQAQPHHAGRAALPHRTAGPLGQRPEPEAADLRAALVPALVGRARVSATIAAAAVLTALVIHAARRPPPSGGDGPTAYRCRAALMRRPGARPAVVD
ncbi:MarR family winged helix-turn-helix transcriptional regulator [Streptomyces sp. NPDC054796]